MVRRQRFFPEVIPFLLGRRLNTGEGGLLRGKVYGVPYRANPLVFGAERMLHTIGRLPCASTNRGLFLVCQSLTWW